MISRQDPRLRSAATGGLAVVLLALTACADNDGQAAADCASQIRRGERVYTGYAYTDRVGTELGTAESAECHDVGEDAAGSVFSADSPQVDVWSVDSYSPDDVLAVPFDDDSFQVFFSESLSAEDVERIAEDLADDRGGVTPGRRAYSGDHR
ncbi:MAG TPA: DUF6281 family protein [Jiangellaceae bacterium]